LITSGEGFGGEEGEEDDDGERFGDGLAMRERRVCGK
jgi:hypothetical protein